MKRKPAHFLLGLTTLVAVSCSPAAPTVIPADLHSPYIGYKSSKYANDRLWLCRPDLPNDRCHADLTATEIHPDGSRTIVPHQPAAAPAVDCFYVYPTVDLGLTPANHTDFENIEPMR